ncbi:MAG: hypothetical protein AAFQ37_15395, partial [Bacteroidota bacterium]
MQYFVQVILWITLPCCAYTQAFGNCQLTYGTSADREAIQLAMFSGSAEAVTMAINQAKSSRGLGVGCPQGDYGPFSPADTTAPSLEEMEAVWQEQYVPGLTNYDVACPELGRGIPTLGLGAYWAQRAEYFDNLPKLKEVADMLTETQYAKANAPTPLVTY